MQRILWGAVLLSAMLAAPPANAQQTLVLKDGDRLTGELTAITGSTWVFKHAGGELRVESADVTSFTTTTPIGVRLADGAILAGTISLAGDRLRLVGADGTARTISPGDLAAVGSPTDLAALRPIRVGFFTPFDKFWGATVGVGFSNKTGNSRSRGLTGDLDITRTSPRDRLELAAGIANVFSAPPGVDSLEKVVEKYYGSLRADVSIADRLFVFAVTRQERDKFQGIDLRSNYSGGLGVQIVATALTDFRFYGSAGYRREAFVTDSVFGTAILGAGTGLTQVLGPAKLAWTIDWTPSADNLKDYRFVSAATLTADVIGGLGFRVSSRNEVNNNPPVGVKKHDWLLTTGLTYSLGR
jgi:putative salt-induced outer membrane protein YdiY